MKIDWAKIKYNIRLRLMPEDELAKNRAMIIAENCANSIQANLVGGNFFTGLFLLLNATTVQIGLINILTYVSNLLQLFSPLFLERFAKRKKMLIWSRIIIHILNIIVIGVAANLPVPDRTRVYIILGVVALLNAVSAFTGPGFSIWHMQSVPERERANYFSINTRLVNLAAYIFILGGGVFVDAFKARGLDMLGFMLLRGLAIGFAALDIWLLARVKEYEYPKGTPPNIAMLFTEPFKCKRYLVSVLIIFLWNFFATTTGSYYTVYMLETLKVNYSFLSVCSAMYVPITMFLAPVWARYINRTSWLAVFWKVLIMYGLFFCGHSFVNVSCIWLYPVVVFLCFLFSPAVNLVMSNMAFYNIPRENQTIYLSFCSTLSMVGAILGNLFATQFMLRTADVDFRVFGMHMLNNQFMPTITGLLIMLLGGIVYFIHRREVAMEKKAPPVPEPF
ncbi:MAG: MFS transporter [Clostridiales bacterium]|jgi:MFS family permease|nr:MFS transporter [Clostridiales bacterium]